MKIVELSVEQFKVMVEEKIPLGQDIAVLLMPIDDVRFMKSYQMLPYCCGLILRDLKVSDMPEIIYVPRYDRYLRNEIGMYFGEMLEAAFIRFDYYKGDFLAVKLASVKNLF